MKQELLVGRQIPRLCNTPTVGISSAWEEVVALAASAGLILDPWQEFVLEQMLQERADGRWASREFAYLVARQNGKGGVLDALCLAALFLFDDEIEIIFSAHEFKTAKKAYRQVKALIKGAPHLLARVERRGNRVTGFRQSNEETSITLDDGPAGEPGCVLRFFARSKDTARGFSPQRLILDEAQELDEETRQNLLYMVSAQANPQFVFTGTVPSDENNSEVWDSLRDRGRAGGDTTLGWLEFTAEQDVDPMSDEAVVASNPALGYRITWETIHAERNACTTAKAMAGFCRERTSTWWDRKGNAVVDLQRWDSLADPHPPKIDEPGIALDVTPDRATGSVAFAGLRPDGRRHLEIVRNAPGTSWIVPLVVELRTQKPDAIVMVDATGPAGSLIDDLEAAGITTDTGLVICSARDMGQACGAIFDAITGEPATVTHFDQPVLNLALGAARWRSLGDARAWARKDVTTDISPLVAVTLALAASVRHLRPSTEPKKKPGRYW